MYERGIGRAALGKYGNLYGNTLTDSSLDLVNIPTVYPLNINSDPSTNDQSERLQINTSKNVPSSKKVSYFVKPKTTPGFTLSRHPSHPVKQETRYDGFDKCTNLCFFFRRCLATFSHNTNILEY